MPQPDSLVLNWHVTEACNYRCKFCYAAWDNMSDSRELIQDPVKTRVMLNYLYDYFRPGSSMSSLSSHLQWNSVRLNLAGGEPLLYSAKLLEVVRIACEMGFEVSLITNASRLNQDVLNQLAPRLTWLGVSIDSISPVKNQAIGRVDRNGLCINTGDLAGRLVNARQNNPNLSLKINTVVNQLNFDENLTGFIQSVSPEKWKILRMLPIVNQNLAVSDQQFKEFVARHQELGSIVCAEDNADMRESYIMIDPKGRFFQNSRSLTGQGYVYSRPIFEVGAEAAFKEITFDHGRFNARYSPVHAGRAT